MILSQVCLAYSEERVFVYSDCGEQFGQDSTGEDPEISYDLSLPAPVHSWHYAEISIQPQNETLFPGYVADIRVDNETYTLRNIPIPGIPFSNGEMYVGGLHCPINIDSPPPPPPSPPPPSPSPPPPSPPPPDTLERKLLQITETPDTWRSSCGAEIPTFFTGAIDEVKVFRGYNQSSPLLHPIPEDHPSREEGIVYFRFNPRGASGLRDENTFVPLNAPLSVENEFNAFIRGDRRNRVGLQFSSVSEYDIPQYMYTAVPWEEATLIEGESSESLPLSGMQNAVLLKGYNFARSNFSYCLFELLGQDTNGSAQVYSSLEKTNAVSSEEIDQYFFEVQTGISSTGIVCDVPQASSIGDAVVTPSNKIEFDEKNQFELLYMERCAEFEGGSIAEDDLESETMNVIGSAVREDSLNLTCPLGFRIDSVHSLEYTDEVACAADPSEEEFMSSIVMDLCSGKANCSFPVSDSLFGTLCPESLPTMTVNVLCSTEWQKIDFIQLPVAEYLDSEYSFSAFVKPMNGSGLQTILSLQGSGTLKNRGLIQLLTDESGLNFLYYDDAIQDAFFMDSPLSSSRWYHLAVTVDLVGNGVAYMDGAAVRRFTTTVRPDATPTGSATLGATFNSSGFPIEYFSGLMDNVAFFERALTPEEVEILSGPKRLSVQDGLIAFYNFDYTYDMFAVDSSGMENHGLLAASSESLWNSSTKSFETEGDVTVHVQKVVDTTPWYAPRILAVVDKNNEKVGTIGLGEAKVFVQILNYVEGNTLLLLDGVVINETLFSPSSVEVDLAAMYSSGKNEITVTSTSFNMSTLDTFTIHRNFTFDDLSSFNPERYYPFSRGITFSDEPLFVAGRNLEESGAIALKANESALIGSPVASGSNYTVLVWMKFGESIPGSSEVLPARWVFAWAYLYFSPLEEVTFDTVYLNGENVSSSETLQNIFAGILKGDVSQVNVTLDEAYVYHSHVPEDLVSMIKNLDTQALIFDGATSAFFNETAETVRSESATGELDDGFLGATATYYSLSTDGILMRNSYTLKELNESWPASDSILVNSKGRLYVQYEFYLSIPEPFVSGNLFVNASGGVRIIQAGTGDLLNTLGQNVITYSQVPINLIESSASVGIFQKMEIIFDHHGLTDAFFQLLYQVGLTFKLWHNIKREKKKKERGINGQKI